MYSIILYIIYIIYIISIHFLLQIIYFTNHKYSNSKLNHFNLPGTTYDLPMVQLKKKNMTYFEHFFSIETRLLHSLFHNNSLHHPNSHHHHCFSKLLHVIAMEQTELSLCFDTRTNHIPNHFLRYNC